MKQHPLYKPFTAFILLLIFIAQILSRPMIVADYLTHVKSYALKCENKTRPQLKCNGKCQMINKINQEEKRDMENRDGKPESVNEGLLSSKSFFATVTLPIIQIITQGSIPFYISSNSTDRCIDIFHPPRYV